MTYKLFLDDERFPPDDGTTWLVCRTVEEALLAISQLGYPSFISFDHDLGQGQRSGLELVKELVEGDMDNGWMNDGFDFYVHSQNPIGAENIRKYLNGYMEFRQREGQ